VIRRALWLGLGIGVGASVATRARRHVERLAPSNALREVRRAVDAAVAEGRREMRDREARLRATFAAPGPTSDAGGSGVRRSGARGAGK
jgi:hypothetical protein